MKHSNENVDAVEEEGQGNKRLRTDNQDDDSKFSISYPFFNYEDFSSQPDPDPLVPLTAPGRVPNFPAKMHAMLSRDDLAEVICWMPHGRAWKVLKPREFELMVLPSYFEHSKFSSFIRQANGWGFRRMNTGRDRNAYYHPQFLRGLPHLCKGMKRPGVAQKLHANPDHEPDLYRLSELHPVPECAGKQSIMSFSTLLGGQKARQSLGSHISRLSNSFEKSLPRHSSSALTLREQEALSSFYASLKSVDGRLMELAQDFSMRMQPSSHVDVSNFHEASVAPSLRSLSHQQRDVRSGTTLGMSNQSGSYETLSAANRLAFSNLPNSNI
jgi:HSF-type DNA-binding